jgi:hypothetical protein
MIITKKYCMIADCMYAKITSNITSLNIQQYFSYIMAVNFIGGKNW